MQALVDDAVGTRLRLESIGAGEILTRAFKLVRSLPPPTPFFFPTFIFSFWNPHTVKGNHLIACADSLYVSTRNLHVVKGNPLVLHEQTVCL
jgi:hypothetical protein